MEAVLRKVKSAEHELLAVNRLLAKNRHNEARAKLTVVLMQWPLN